MAYVYTRQQILEEANRLLEAAAVLDDSEPDKDRLVERAYNLSQVVMARVHHALTLNYYNLPDDL